MVVVPGIPSSIPRSFITARTKTGAANAAISAGLRRARRPPQQSRHARLERCLAGDQSKQPDQRLLLAVEGHTFGGDGVEDRSDVVDEEAAAISARMGAGVPVTPQTAIV